MMLLLGAAMMNAMHEVPRVGEPGFMNADLGNETEYYRKIKESGLTGSQEQYIENIKNTQSEDASEKAKQEILEKNKAGNIQRFDWGVKEDEKFRVTDEPKADAARLHQDSGAIRLSPSHLTSAQSEEPVTQKEAREFMQLLGFARQPSEEAMTPVLSEQLSATSSEQEQAEQELFKLKENETDQEYFNRVFGTNFTAGESLKNMLQGLKQKQEEFKKSLTSIDERTALRNDMLTQVIKHIESTLKQQNQTAGQQEQVKQEEVPFLPQAFLFEHQSSLPLTPQPSVHQPTEQELEEAKQQGVASIEAHEKNFRQFLELPETATIQEMVNKIQEKVNDLKREKEKFSEDDESKDLYQAALKDGQIEILQKMSESVESHIAMGGQLVDQAFREKNFNIILPLQGVVDFSKKSIENIFDARVRQLKDKIQDRSVNAEDRAKMEGVLQQLEKNKNVIIDEIVKQHQSVADVGPSVHQPTQSSQDLPDPAQIRQETKAATNQLFASSSQSSFELRPARAVVQNVASDVIQAEVVHDPAGINQIHQGIVTENLITGVISRMSDEVQSNPALKRSFNQPAVEQELNQVWNHAKSNPSTARFAGNVESKLSSSPLLEDAAKTLGISLGVFVGLSGIVFLIMYELITNNVI